MAIRARAWKAHFRNGRMGDQAAREAKGPKGPTAAVAALSANGATPRATCKIPVNAATNFTFLSATLFSLHWDIAIFLQCTRISRCVPLLCCTNGRTRTRREDDSFVVKCRSILRITHSRVKKKRPLHSENKTPWRTNAHGRGRARALPTKDLF